jgi:hypothetical protein
MVDLLVLTSLDQLFLIENIIHICTKTTYLNEELYWTEPSPSVSVPCPKLLRRFLNF